MFASIPRKLSVPFGILGDEAKLAFRSQPGGIAKLASTRNIAQSDAYWDQYITLFDSASDVFSLISPHDIRRALIDAPENVATLIRVVTSSLFNLVSDHTFPTPPTSVTSYASSFIKSSTGAGSRNTTKEVLNCLRTLQRVLPVVFESDSEFELDVFWRAAEVPEDPGDRDTSTSPQFVIEDDEASDNEQEGSSSASPRRQKPVEQKKQLLPLGERLSSCLIDLLFCCGFTLPPQLQVDHYKINYAIWEKGIGSTSDPGPSHAYDNNRTEVLRLLLVLFSRQIYVPSPSLLTKPSLFTLHFVQNRPRRDVLTVLCSLLNTAMNSGRPVGTTIGNVAGKLPYNHLVFKGEDPRAILVSMCLQVLCLLLDFQSGSARDRVAGSGESQSAAPTTKTNAFRYFLVKLHRTQDLAFIVEGIAGILEQEMATMQNILPGAKKSVPYVFETIILFWKMIELNKKFKAFVLESDRATDMLAYLLCYCVEIKDKPQQHGMCRALSYIVQTLSAEPAFGAKLSSPIKAQVPAKWSAAGTAADFMINAIYTIISTTSGALNSLYPALIIALANVAPYFKNLTVTSSTRLVQLFTSFSNPVFLLADEGHPRLLFFMLEVFNAVIYHHIEENPNLIYGILSSHRAFEDLGTFTLSKGLSEVRRVQKAKEEQARRAEDKARVRSSGEGAERDTRAEKSSRLQRRDAGGEGGSEDEKARLMRSENAADVDLERGRDSISNSPAEQGNNVANPGASESQSSISPPGEVVDASSEDVSGVSAKARGKMKARRSASLDSLERIAAAGIGRNGFVPTEEWVASWQQGLPLDTIMLMVSELLPKIQEMQATRQRPNPTPAVMDFLSSVTLKHVLPPTPPIVPRKFQWSDASMIWLTSLIWGDIYVRGMTPLAIWNATNVRLFYVKHMQAQQRQITETVSNVVGGILGRTNSTDSFGGRQRSERP